MLGRIQAIVTSTLISWARGTFMLSKVEHHYHNQVHTDVLQVVAQRVLTGLEGRASGGSW